MRMLSTLAMASAAFAALALQAAESDYQSMSKLVPAKANSLVYAKPSAFAGHPLLESLKNIPDAPEELGAAVNTGSAIAKLFDGAIAFGNPPVDGGEGYGALILRAAGPLDLAALDAAIPESAVKCEPGKFGDADVLLLSVLGDDPDAAKMVIMELEPGLFILFSDDADGKAVLADVKARQGVNPELAAQVAPVQNADAFAVINIPADATPVFQRFVVSVEKTGADGVVAKLHTVVYGDFVTDTEFAVTAVQLNAYLAKIKAWDEAMEAQAAAGDDQDAVAGTEDAAEPVAEKVEAKAEKEVK